MRSPRRPLKEHVARFKAFSILLALTVANGSKASDLLGKVSPEGQTITFWYQHTREREEALKQLIEEFNQINPHRIKVVGEYAGRYEDIYNKMILGMRTGDVADLIVAYQNQSATYALTGGIVDLEPYLRSERWGLTEQDRDDFFPAFLQQDWAGNFRLGFPPNRSMEVLYYNEDWLKELGYDAPPATWKAFQEMARAARDKPFSRSLNKKVSLGYELSVDTSRFAAMVFSRGGALISPDLRRYTLHTPQARAVLLLLRDLIEDGCASLVAEQNGDQADFGAGGLLFTIASSSGLLFYENVVSQGARFKWSVASLPHDGSMPIQNVYGASLSIPKTTPERQLAAWIFIKWFTEPEPQAKWARASNYFPVRRSVSERLAPYFEENPSYKKAFDLLQYGKSEPPVPGYDSVRELIEEAMIDVIDGEDPDEILNALETEANQNLSLYLKR